MDFCYRRLPPTPAKRPCVTTTKTLCLGAMLMAPAFVHAAGFDCAKAVTPVEKAICAAPKTSALDGEFGEAHGCCRLSSLHRRRRLDGGACHYQRTVMLIRTPWSFVPPLNIPR